MGSYLGRHAATKHQQARLLFIPAGEGDAAQGS